MRTQSSPVNRKQKKRRWSPKKMMENLPSMEVHLIDEPKLELGNRGLHPDLRFGIMEHGPSDLGRERKPSEIKLSVVGTEQSIEDACLWLDTVARGGYQGSGSPKKNLFPAFPGFSRNSGFGEAANGCFNAPCSPPRPPRGTSGKRVPTVITRNGSCG